MNCLFFHEIAVVDRKLSLSHMQETLKTRNYAAHNTNGGKHPNI